jgi:hypothetical protein
MDVICADVDCLQQPISDLAGFTNRRFDRFAMGRLQQQRLGL